MTAQNKTPQCCGETLKVVKNSDGIFSYTCPKCGKSATGKNPAEAAAVWGQGNQGQAGTQTAPEYITDLPAAPATLQKWAQSNMSALLRYSAAWLDVSDKAEKPATKRMINKNLEYVVNNTQLSRAWETDEGRRALVAALKDSFYYGATMPEMGCIVPYGAVVEFIPDVEAFRFALTSGNTAPFESLTIELIHATDKYKCGRKNGDFFIEFENIQAKRGDVIGVAVYGKRTDTGNVDGEVYDVERLMEKAETHSPAYQYYKAELNLAAQMKVEGKTLKEGNREYFIKEMNKKGGGTWEKKIYVDEIRNPYVGADQPEMLRKLAGKTFCRPYMKVRNAAELAAEWSGDDEIDVQETGTPAEAARGKATDSVLQKAAGQFGCSQAPYNKEEAENIKDAEIVEEEDRI